MNSQKALLFLSLIVIIFLGLFTWIEPKVSPNLLKQINLFSMTPPLISFLVGIHFGRSKIVLISLLLLFFQFSIIMGEELKITIENIPYSLTLWIPISFLILGLMGEKGLLGKPALLRYILTASIGGVAYWTFIKDSIAQTLQTNLFDIPLPFTPTTQIGIILYVIALLFLIFVNFLESKQVEKSLHLALLIAGLPILIQDANFALFMGGAGIIFGIALSQDAYKMAYIDTLTGIPSRRAMEEYFDRLSPPYTIGMSDIDHFKSFNDTYGHDVGDEVLRKVAHTLKKVEGGGRVFRYGGEEFAIVFANKEAKECKIYLESLREQIAEQGFIVRSKERAPKKSNTVGKKVNLTISIGACDNSWGNSIPAIVKKADTLLYSAKKAGRNCVKIAPKKKD
jgi:diguanylate cyclase (GGDEF)-like protein